MKKRFWMIPPTCGRTSAIKKADVLPGKSVLIAMRWGFTSTTVTSCEASRDGALAVEFPHPASVHTPIKTNNSVINPDILEFTFVAFVILTCTHTSLLTKIYSVIFSLSCPQ